jgi:hypothetical protein
MESPTTHNKASVFRNLLNRGNLRDAVVLISAGSALLFPIDLATAIAGFTVLVAGGALHVLTKGVLIRNEVLCAEGVYAIVRNPYYLSNYLIDSSFCLLSGNIYLLFLYPFLFFWAYRPALKKEETLLYSIYGATFAKYVAETPQVFPSAGAVGKLRQLFAGFSQKRLTANEFKRMFRYAGIGCFIMLLRDISDEGLREALFWARPQDYDGAVFLALFVVLALTSLLIPRRMARPAR